MVSSTKLSVAENVGLQFQIGKYSYIEQVGSLDKASDPYARGTSAGISVILTDTFRGFIQLL
jgi:hypothetical protein